LENDPYFDLDPNPKLARERVKKKLQELQRKLPAMPKSLPERIITPQEFVTDPKSKQIVGYTMRFLGGSQLLASYADPAFARGGAYNQTVFEAFLDLHKTVRLTHAERVVFGDFNYFNILLLGSEAYVIDADSMQMPPDFWCHMYTQRFVDPRLCEWDDVVRLNLVRPHDELSDHYAYTAMLMECLLGVGPYDGIHRPKDKSLKVLEPKRPLHKVSVFDPEVKYPKYGVPLGRLPDDLLEYFDRTFSKGERQVFPESLLQNARWTTCTECGVGHARAQCPGCQKHTPEQVRQVVQIRGTVTATRVYSTRDLLVAATYQNGNLHWLSAGHKGFTRETGKVILEGNLLPNMRFRLHNSETYIGLAGTVARLSADGQSVRSSVDSYGLLPMFDSNGKYAYRLEGGSLLRDTPLGAIRVGGVLQGQTLFWVGGRFGFGFYRAGNYNVFFVFDAEGTAINDSVKLTPIRGQLLDAWCTFSDGCAWFFTSTQEAGQTVHRCSVITQTGKVVATHEVKARDGSWLGGGIRGKLALGDFLLAPTDAGIVAVKPIGADIVVTKEYPDTEPFVHASTLLLPGAGGIHAVGSHDIYFLRISNSVST
jgi:H/ACA ribonucleoprotein complex subunit 3